MNKSEVQRHVIWNISELQKSVHEPLGQPLTFEEEVLCDGFGE